MLASWQSLPLSLDPIIGYLYTVPVTWYAACYIFGAVFSAMYFIWRARRKGLLPDIFTSIDLIVTVLWGVVIGARLGYVLFYGGDEFFREPWRIISPYDFGEKEWIGIRGMSFHGGLVGGVIGLWMFTREANRRLLEFADVLVQAVPIALFFGRIGNFLNLEIIGRATSVEWGIRLPFSEGMLRHPVTLYEALLEGVLLFLILLVGSRFLKTPGRLTAVFLLAYASFRIFAEGYRDIPIETMVLGGITTGQALSLVMGVIGFWLLFFPRPRVVQ